MYRDRWRVNGVGGEMRSNPQFHTSNTSASNTPQTTNDRQVIVDDTTSPIIKNTIEIVIVIVAAGNGHNESRP